MVLEGARKGKEVRVDKALEATLVPLALGLLRTFPLLFSLFAAGEPWTG
jgi:hypothetical protein